MNRADRKRWAAATSLPELGELTALWLEGAIKSQPGYCDPDPGEPWGPDPETVLLVPVLAAVNRAGFVTYGSQPGQVYGDYRDGAGVPLDGQRAAVSGFADDDTLRWLRAACAGYGLNLAAARPRRWFSDRRAAVVVTRDYGRDFTRFGTVLPRSYVNGTYSGICSRQAVAALREAWQVTITDPVWGRNTQLWPVLDGFAYTTRARSTTP